MKLTTDRMTITESTDEIRVCREYFEREWKPWLDPHAPPQTWKGYAIVIDDRYPTPELVAKDAT